MCEGHKKVHKLPSDPVHVHHIYTVHVHVHHNRYTVHVFVITDLEHVYTRQSVDNGMNIHTHKI